MSAEIQPKTDPTSAAIARLGWEAGQINVIQKSVAKDATLPELYQFLYLCKAYDLDPFKREIYFMKDDKGRSSIITGIDGFRKAAKRDPHYKGVIAFAVKEGDEFAIDAAAYTVVHKFGGKRGAVIGAWARADADGKLPVIVWVDFAEFNKRTYTWNQMPAVMIAKVAESHAIRRQFGLAGLYTQEEMGVEKVSTAHEAAPPIIDADYIEQPEEPQKPAETSPDEQATEQVESNGTVAEQSITPDDDKDDANPNFAKLWAAVRNMGKPALTREVVHQIAAKSCGMERLTSLKQLPQFTTRELNKLILDCATYKAA